MTIPANHGIIRPRVDSDYSLHSIAQPEHKKRRVDSCQQSSQPVTTIMHTDTTISKCHCGENQLPKNGSQQTIEKVTQENPHNTTTQVPLQQGSKLEHSNPNTPAPPPQVQHVKSQAPHVQAQVPSQVSHVYQQSQFPSRVPSKEPHIASQASNASQSVQSQALTSQAAHVLSQVQHAQQVPSAPIPRTSQVNTLSDQSSGDEAKLVFHPLKKQVHSPSVSAIRGSNDRPQKKTKVPPEPPVVSFSPLSCVPGILRQKCTYYLLLFYKNRYVNKVFKKAIDSGMEPTEAATKSLEMVRSDFLKFKLTLSRKKAFSNSHGVEIFTKT